MPEPPEQFRGVFRATADTPSAAEPADALGVEWSCQWQDGPPHRWDLSPAERAAVRAFLPGLRDGSVDWQRIREIAPTIGKALPLPESLLTADGVPWAEIELLTAGGDERLLTEIPLEAGAACVGALPDPPALHVDSLLARLPLVRVVDSASAFAGPMRFRPRALWLVANPPGAGGQIDIGAFGNICRQTLAQFPFLETSSLSVAADRLTWPVARAEIARRRPNVFVLVAHGDSSEAGADPVVKFRDATRPAGIERVPVRDIARALEATGSIWLALFVCCDLVRRAAYSGAVELVRSGVPEVIAMQGSIAQGAAQLFLEGALADLLVRRSVGVSAASGRRRAGRHPHACLPAVFASAAQRKQKSPLDGISEAYDEARQTLAVRAVPASVYMERSAPSASPLPAAFDRALGTAGLIVVTGSFGNGVSELVKGCVRRLALPENRPLARPALYIDLELAPPGIPRHRFILSELTAALASHPLLASADPLAGPTPDAEAASYLFRSVNSAGITVILDHAEAPAGGDETAFWTEVLRAAAVKCSDGLVCVIPRGLPVVELAGGAAGAIRRIEVPPFELNETAEYVRQHLQGFTVTTVHAASGGTPLLLDAIRKWRERNKTASAASMPSFADLKTVTQYVSLVEASLSPEAREALARVACVEGPVGKEEAVEHIVGAHAAAALDELISAGIVHESHMQQRNLVHIPQLKADAIRHAHAAALPEARRQIAELFRHRDEDQRADVVAELARGVYGFGILYSIQQSLASSGEWEEAAFLPLDAAGPGVDDAQLFRLYEVAIEVNREHAGPEGADPELVLNAAALAQNLGVLEDVKRLLDQLGEGADDFQRARALKVRAAWLKDTAQADQLAEIQACFGEAMEIVGRTHDDDPEVASASEWDELRRDLLTNSLPSLLFLAGMRYGTLPPEQRGLIDTMPASADKAVVLCTLAEREMKEGPNADWESVARWVAESDAMIAGSPDARAVTYCAYQYGQYLRQHYPDRHREAYERYLAADEAGRASGEVRRWAIARFRRVELLLAHPQLAGAAAPSAPPPDTRQLSRELLEEVLRQSAERPADALEARARGRLCTLRATLAATQEEADGYLVQAATALSVPALNAASDHARFLPVVADLLARQLGDGGDFRLAQQLLVRFGGRLEKLGIDVRYDDPDRVLDAVRARLN